MEILLFVLLVGGAIELYRKMKRPSGGFVIVETLSIRRRGPPRWVNGLCWIIFFFVVCALLFGGDDKPKQQQPTYHRTAYVGDAGARP